MLDRLYNELCQRLNNNGKRYDADKIKEAYKIAHEAHKEQFRVSGEPYITHPIQVALIIMELGMDTDCVCAAILHDVVEDTPTSVDKISETFGKDVALLVDGVTKLGKVPLSTKEEEQAENLRKMLLAMSQDIRVIIIKLADRLHNMRTMEAMPDYKQRSKSLETMEIYAPIANRLGIMHIKEELEDRSLFFLDPVAYNEIVKTLDMGKNNKQAVIESIKARIALKLSEYNMSPNIEGRVKSKYGIYRKVFMTGKTFDEVYDIYAVRVIVDTDIDCYNVLGVMHDMFTPIPNRFKDYIATPKPNMYRSLHTTVMSKEGIIFEIQIRTWDMHYTAEYGIAAHWKYKEGITGKDQIEDRLAWVRQLLESQQESGEAEDIVKSIKTDLTPEEVFAYTPKGMVKSLPLGSTVIDFAYSIHSEVGNKMIGAKADGKIVSLEHKIQMGEVIEILTTKSRTHGPNKHWINIVKTSEARSKIRAWFKKERREENIVEGKLELEKELKKNYIRLDEEQYQDLIERLCKRYSYNEDDLFAAIGYGGIVLSKIMPNLREQYLKMVKSKIDEDNVLTIDDVVGQTKNKLTGDVIVEGLDNCLVKFSQCCNPLPGDDIFGYITRGHGVSVHKKDCINMVSLLKDPEQKDRCINVHWSGEEVAKTYQCTLDIIARDRDGLFADVSTALANLKIPIHEINARQLKNGNAILVVSISLQGVEHLKNIIQKITKIQSVISVERSGK